MLGERNREEQEGRHAVARAPESVTREGDERCQIDGEKWRTCLQRQGNARCLRILEHLNGGCWEGNGGMAAIGDCDDAGHASRRRIRHQLSDNMLQWSTQLMCDEDRSSILSTSSVLILTSRVAAFTVVMDWRESLVEDVEVWRCGGARTTQIACLGSVHLPSQPFRATYNIRFSCFSAHHRT